MKLITKLILLGAAVVLLLFLGSTLGFLGFGLMSTDLMYGPVLYCTLVLAVLILCCTGIIVSHLKKEIPPIRRSRTANNASPLPQRQGRFLYDLQPVAAAGARRPPAPPGRRDNPPPAPCTGPFLRSRRRVPGRLPGPAAGGGTGPGSRPAPDARRPLRGDVLQIFPGGAAGVVDQGQEPLHVAVFQGLHLAQHPAVLVKHMDGPQHRPVPGGPGGPPAGGGKNSASSTWRSTSAPNRRHTAPSSRGWRRMHR